MKWDSHIIFVLQSETIVYDFIQCSLGEDLSEDSKSNVGKSDVSSDRDEKQRITLCS